MTHKSPKNTARNAERIELFRGTTVVSSLLGAFGVSLRETRLTAMLGYLISLSPHDFLDLFRLSGETTSVWLETSSDGARSDIAIETTQGTAVIEAKIGTDDPVEQAWQYHADQRILLTSFRPGDKQKRHHNVHYITWEDLAGLLRKLGKGPMGKKKLISSDLLKYMEEHRMIHKREVIEIYSREINEEKTLVLFLDAAMYGCYYEKRNTASEALYFAPHFGRKIANRYPGIHAGISYVARIISTRDMIESWKELVDVTQEIKGGNWLNANMKYLEPLRMGWKWKKPHTFLFLDKPRLVFNPPVRKQKLQGGTYIKHKLKFDDLFKVCGA